MPLGKNVSKNIRELYADNKKKGKARGAGGKPRSRKQILAISLSVSRKNKKVSKKEKDMMMTKKQMMKKMMK